MEIILNILLAVAAAYVFTEVLQLHKRWKGALDCKPFNCPTCLSGWLSLPLWSFDGYPLVQLPYLVCLAMVASVLIRNALSKYI